MDQFAASAVHQREIDDALFQLDMLHDYWSRHNFSRLAWKPTCSGEMVQIMGPGRWYIQARHELNGGDDAAQRAVVLDINKRFDAMEREIVG